MNKYSNIFSGKRITVMGLGLLGRGLNDTLFLVKSGAKVTVTDLKSREQLAASLENLRDLPVRIKVGGHDPEDFIETDMVLRNADVPKSSPFLKLARDHGVPVEMDESLFCKHFNGRVVGITGTRGKTTTTEIAYRVLKQVEPRTFLAGNIMGLATLPLLAEVEQGDTVVMELSSWQLQGFHEAKLSPNASVFTNIYPDHLNRYTGMEDYVEDKKAIYLYQSGDDFCLFNGDQEATRALYAEAPAGRDFFSYTDTPVDLNLKIPGPHNISNVGAVWRLATKLGIQERTIREVVENFTGVEHRLESIGSCRGIRFVNDSTSTTPIAGIMALKSMKAQRIFLIAGGADKKLDLKPFAEEASRTAYRIALLEGSATSNLHSDLALFGAKNKILGIFDDLKKAVLCAYDQASAGDVILLSPGCASFGLFVNEFHRGDCFKAIVREIIS
ncbi:MAG: UDP-N-acetylmuramoyl-L-alanine--D-glutamate ligase [Desulfomonilaceae bacterium]